MISMQSFDPIAFEDQIQEMPLDLVLRKSSETSALLKRNPRNFELHFSLALMLCRTEEYGLAIKHLKKAHKVNARSEIILKTLCELLLLQVKKYADAMRFLKKWAFLRNDLAIIPAYIAECLLNLGRTDEALQTLTRAEKIDPDELQIHIIRCEVYSKLGNADQAKASLDRVMESGGKEKAIIRLAQLPNFEAPVETLETMIKLAAESDNKGSQSSMYGAIAAGYEKLKLYEDAFRFYELTNKLPARRLDEKKELSGFKNARDTFTRQFLVKKSGLGLKSDQPIFIVGMPRSGTTLTESILAGHPAIIDNGELSYFHGQMKSRGLYTQVNALLKDQLPSMEKFYQKLPDNAYRAIGEGYFNYPGFNNKSNKRQVDKLPHNFMAVGLISIVFPNAKIIHCRRHPVDGALSCFKANFNEFHAYATELKFLGLYYRQYWELMKHWREVLPGKMFEVYYEDTVANTEIVARNMIEHVGLEWDNACLDHTSSKKTVSTASMWQVRQPIYTSSVAKWKNYEKQLQPMINAMGSCVADYEAELAALSL